MNRNILALHCPTQQKCGKQTRQDADEKKSSQETLQTGMSIVPIDRKSDYKWAKAFILKIGDSFERHRPTHYASH